MCGTPSHCSHTVHGKGSSTSRRERIYALFVRRTRFRRTPPEALENVLFSMFPAARFSLKSNEKRNFLGEHISIDVVQLQASLYV